MKKKGPIDWPRICSWATFTLLAIIILVACGLLSTRLQDYHDAKTPIQSVYQIYEDEYTICYQITAGTGANGVFYKETQQCIRK